MFKSMLMAGAVALALGFAEISDTAGNTVVGASQADAQVFYAGGGYYGGGYYSRPYYSGYRGFYGRPYYGGYYGAVVRPRVYRPYYGGFYGRPYGGYYGYGGYGRGFSYFGPRVGIGIRF
ncbi:hypothetical protein [Stratiformator vulcanicus]|uniref:Uncharacterized protein n=1 Tax=Stratiformator vulcanicus TaxID=2527980 RepID=A0A517R7V9_9PLAN|nr:hypothetical protein [Stratiformator vulcanicus]QDT39942.1 hypothetical protein Pan189_43540 [Stratiformator vulcanicus]